MRSILFHAIQSERPRDWMNFRREAQVSVKSPGYADRLAENVWLIAADDPRLTVDQLLHIARKNAIACRTLEFDLGQQWQDHPSPV